MPSARWVRTCLSRVLRKEKSSLAATGFNTVSFLSRVVAKVPEIYGCPLCTPSSARTSSVAPTPLRMQPWTPSRHTSSICSFSSDAVNTPRHANERVLHQVLRDREVAGQQVGEPHGVARMPHVEVTQRVATRGRHRIHVRSQHLLITGSRTRRSPDRFHEWFDTMRDLVLAPAPIERSAAEPPRP